MKNLVRNRASRAALLCMLALAPVSGCGSSSDNENKMGSSPAHHDSGASGSDGDDGSNNGDGNNGSGGNSSGGARDGGSSVAAMDSGTRTDPPAWMPDDSGLGPEGGRMGPDGAVQVRAQPDDECVRYEFPQTASNYWFCSAPLTPSIAAGFCWAAGGTLVVINDEAENNLIVSQLAVDEAIIGYSDSAEEGNWEWADGTSSGYANWAPENPGLDDFAFVSRESKLWTTSVDEARPYVCEDWKEVPEGSMRPEDLPQQ
jgi:hypothetical protein